MPNATRFSVSIHPFFTPFVYKLQFAKMVTTALSNKHVNYLVHIRQLATGARTGC